MWRCLFFLVAMLAMNTPGSMPMPFTATSQAPIMPTELYTMHNNGNIVTPASRRGDSRY